MAGGGGEFVGGRPVTMVMMAVVTAPEPEAPRRLHPAPRFKLGIPGRCWACAAALVSGLCHCNVLESASRGGLVPGRANACWCAVDGCGVVC